MRVVKTSCMPNSACSDHRVKPHVLSETEDAETAEICTRARMRFQQSGLRMLSGHHGGGAPIQ